jgi:hypothetical protein
MDPAPPSVPAKPKRKRVWKVLGWTAVVLTFIGIAIYFFSIEWIRRALSGLDLIYTIGTAARIYAVDHDQLYPPLSPEAGRLMYATETISLDNTTFLAPWFYPGEPGKEDVYLPELTPDGATQAIREYVNDQSYYYLGYAISNEIEGRAFIRAYKEVVNRGGNFNDDLTVPMGEGNFGGDKLFRLRDDMVEYLQQTRGMSELDVRRWEASVVCLMQNPRKRAKGFFPPPDRTAGVVYFLDGHTDHQRVPGAFPYTEEFLSALEELDRMSDNGPPERPAR